MTKSITQCPNCLDNVTPDNSGSCPLCGANIIPIHKDPAEELQFYCVVCRDFFFACRDGTGYDQAPCPNCGDLSNTPDFHVAEMARGHHEKQVAWFWILKILAIMFASGVGWAIFKGLF